jgi:hypothetical protein
MRSKKAKRIAQRSELFMVSKLGMHYSENQWRHFVESVHKRATSCAALFFIILFLFAFSAPLSAAIRDRVVAYVDNMAITLSDLEDRYAETTKFNADITKEEVLETIINRTLMLREAKRMRLEALSESLLLNEYIDLKVKAFIRIKDETIKEFYNGHIENFQGKEFEDVSEEIENYLTEGELNQRLKTHINGLREKACVQMQLEQK